MAEVSLLSICCSEVFKLKVELIAFLKVPALVNMAFVILQAVVLLLLPLSNAIPTNLSSKAPTEPDPSMAVSVELAGKTFINKASINITQF